MPRAWAWVLRLDEWVLMSLLAASLVFYAMADCRYLLIFVCDLDLRHYPRELLDYYFMYETLCSA